MSSAVKRAFEDADDGSPNSKRARTDDNGSTKPATSAADEIARKKAEIQAKFAAMRQQNQAGPSTKVTGPGAAAAAAKAKEDIQRRIAETARKLESKGGNVSHPFLVRVLFLIALTHAGSIATTGCAGCQRRRHPSSASTVGRQESR